MVHVIAIDGPSGAGKSSVSRLVASRLRFLHVDSGALYRLMAWIALQAKADPEDEAAVAAAIEAADCEFVVRDGQVVCLVHGEDPGEALRTPEINRAVSPVAKMEFVRTKVTQWLREMKSLGGLVVEGRDIGTVVFPDSPARFYLDADPAVRAQRRHAENQEKQGAGQSREAVLESILRRDRIDSTRAIAPLRQAEGAFRIDSTNLSLEEVVRTVLDHLPADWP
ncbi:MAG: (d)CMP kinase [Kiritimatiellia bacterium]|jgi:cytidylate kinase